MPETLQAPLRDQTDVKIFILSLMDGIDRPLNFVQINDIVVQNGVVKPFDFCLAFPDLLETGHIVMETSAEGEEFYSITPLGRDAARNLGSKLLHVTKEKALQNAVLLLNMQKNGESYRYNIEALPGGKYCFHLHFSKDKEDVISLSVVVENQKKAENMEIEFEQHPELFRRSLLALLTNSAEEILSYAPYQLL